MTDDEARVAATDGRAEFRVWWVPQIPMEGFQHPAPDFASARFLANALGQYDLFQFENNVKPDYCNMGGVEWRHPLVTEGAWESLDDDDAIDLGLAEGSPEAAQVVQPIRDEPSLKAGGGDGE